MLSEELAGATPVVEDVMMDIPYRPTQLASYDATNAKRTASPTHNGRQRRGGYIDFRHAFQLHKEPRDL
jgi:hypothetical protein